MLVLPQMITGNIESQNHFWLAWSQSNVNLCSSDPWSFYIKVLGTKGSARYSYNDWMVGNNMLLCFYFFLKDCQYRITGQCSAPCAFAYVCPIPTDVSSGMFALSRSVQRLRAPALVFNRRRNHLSTNHWSDRRINSHRCPCSVGTLTKQTLCLGNRIIYSCVLCIV